jgi:tetratricopeptide (TPR) repeat protein
MLTRSVMLTIKKRSFALRVLAVISAAALTGCGPPGPRDLRKGERLIQSGEFAAALPVLDEGVQLLRDAPGNVQATAWNLVGLAQHGSGHPEEAARAYLEALKLDRNLWAADYNLGCLRLEQTNFLEAIDYLTTYTTSCPKDINGFLLLGRARLKLAMDRAGSEKARQMQLESARWDFDSAEKIRGTAEACNDLGLIDLMQRRTPGSDPLKASIASFRLALQDEPHYPPALLNLAIVLQRYANDPHEALQTYREYLDLKPAMPDAGEVEKVARQLDTELRISITPPKAEHPVAPTNSSVSRQPPVVVENPLPKPAPPPIVKAAPKEKPVVLAQVSPPPANPSPQTPVETSTAPVIQTNPPESAVNPSTNAATTTPEVAPPEEKRSTLVQKLNPLNWFGKSKKTDASETATGEAAVVERYSYPLYVTPIPGDRKLAEKLTGEGRQAEHQSNRTEAMWDYQEAIKADPTYFEAGLALGLAEIDAKDYPAALSALGQALTLRATSADARYAFAWVLGRQGYYQDAADELDKLLSAHPQELRGHLLLGNYYADNLAQPKLAREHYLRALELIDPQSAQAGVIRTWLEQHQ